VRILVVSQFLPGPRDPDLGVFVAQIADELERRGNVVARVAVRHRGGRRTKHARLAARAVAAAVRFRPDVIYGHFLVPAGAFAVLAGALVRTPVVITAHGQDVRNLGVIPGVRGVTAWAVRRAAGVVTVSDYLRRELEARVPAAAGRVEVIDCGVDLDRFAPADAEAARRALGWEGEGPRHLFVGWLGEHKNVVGLAEAFARVEGGSLTYVGDGPLRGRLEGRPGVRLVGRVPHDEVREWMAASDVVCLPSPVESFGQVLLEAMACARSVVATRVGGPPEFVTPEAGVLVDPTSVDSIAEGMQRAAALPRPNTDARRVAVAHDLRRQAARVEWVLARACGAAAP
jgi:glycosyltransferase involved in cell wall biosynthesis